MAYASRVDNATACAIPAHYHLDEDRYARIAQLADALDGLAGLDDHDLLPARSRAALLGALAGEARAITFGLPCIRPVLSH